MDARDKMKRRQEKGRRRGGEEEEERIGTVRVCTLAVDVSS